MTTAINRWQLLGTTGAVVSVALVPAAAWAASVIPKPPVARVMPVTETLFGTTLTDNYCWMETANDPDWMPFMKGQNATARATLAAIPGRDALLKRISALSGDAVATKTVQRVGTLTFIEQRPAGANNFKLYVQNGGGAMRLLVDPETLGTAGRHVSLDWWAASPDGSHLVYGLSPAGSRGFDRAGHGRRDCPDLARANS